MSERVPAAIRISLATPQADLAAVVWPGVTLIYLPRAESANQVQEVDVHLTQLERSRGIRPRTVEILPLVETPRGVSLARPIASSSGRIQAFGVGPNLALGMGVEDDASIEALKYARSECELQARALGLEPVDLRLVMD